MGEGARFRRRASILQSQNLTDMAETTIPSPAPATDVRLETMVERLRRRARLVLALRLAVLVFLIGRLELGVRAGVFAPVFFGHPTGISGKLLDWFQNSTSIGPLWQHIS